MSFSQSGDRPERRMYEGNWTCAKCGAKITSLPFDPDPERLHQLKCRDCHRATKRNFKRF